MPDSDSKPYASQVCNRLLTVFKKNSMFSDNSAGLSLSKLNELDLTKPGSAKSDLGKSNEADDTAQDIELISAPEVQADNTHFSTSSVTQQVKKSDLLQASQAARLLGKNKT